MKQFCDLMLKNWKIRILSALGLVLALTLIAAGVLGQGDPVFDCAQLDEFIIAGTALYPEERQWYDENCVEKEEEFIVWPPLPTPTPRPPIDTCGQLPADIVVSGHRQFTTQCQRLGAAGVGHDALVAQGILDALDVWVNVDAEMLVCFRQRGSLKFLDAATSPRLVSDLAAEYIDGLTCGRINRVGTVVLLPGGAAAPDTAADTSGGESLLTATSAISTTSCELVTNARLSLRAGPSIFYSRLLSMPRGSRFVARARIGDWYMVNFKGQWGWSSAEHMTASPGCDALDDERAVILPPIVETPPTEAEASMADTEESMPDADTPAMSGCQLTTVSIINLRAGPGLEYEVLAEIPYQATLSATAEADDWFKVEFKSHEGWVSREYVYRWGSCDVLGEAGEMMPPAEADAEMADTEESMPDADSPAMSGCQLTTVSIINLRAGPGLEYEVLAEIPYQATLSATAESNDWFKVEYMSHEGWVSREYVYRWGSCDVLGVAGEMMPAPTPEASAPEAEAQEVMAEDQDMEMPFEDARPLTDCNLRSGDIINLRGGPGLEYAVIAEIPNETNLMATARTSDWFKVEHEAAVGWVNIDYVFRSGACG